MTWNQKTEIAVVKITLLSRATFRGNPDLRLHKEGAKKVKRLQPWQLW